MALFLEKSFSFLSQRNVYTHVWSDSKESACNAGDLGSIPGSGRSTGKGNGYPLKCSCLENSMDRGAHSRIQSMGLQKVGHNWATNTFTFFLFSLGNKIESVSRNIFEGPSYSSLSWLASAAAELDEKSHHQENDLVLDNWHSQQVATLKKSSANTTAEVHLSATQWKPCIIHVGTKKLLGAPSVNEIRSHPKEEHVCLTTPISIKVLTHSSTSSPLTRRATH